MPFTHWPGRRVSTTVLTLPDTATKRFGALVADYKAEPIKFPKLRSITFAQWAKESGWGTSKLARQHLNYGGMKWRPYMNLWAEPVEYVAWDAPGTYCKFPDHQAWIHGYWGRFGKEPAYKGWEEKAAIGPEAFIHHIGPIWLGMSPQDNAAYVLDVLRIEKLVRVNFEVSTNDPPDDHSGPPADVPFGRLRPDADFK